MELEKEKQMKPKERKDRMIRTQINELENRKAIEKINKIKRWFFKKLIKIN